MIVQIPVKRKQTTPLMLTTNNLVKYETFYNKFKLSNIITGQITEKN